MIKKTASNRKHTEEDMLAITQSYVDNHLETLKLISSDEWRYIGDDIVAKDDPLCDPACCHSVVEPESDHGAGDEEDERAGISGGGRRPQMPIGRFRGGGGRQVECGDVEVHLGYG